MASQLFFPPTEVKSGLSFSSSPWKTPAHKARHGLDFSFSVNASLRRNGRSRECRGAAGDLQGHWGEKKRWMQLEKKLTRQKWLREASQVTFPACCAPDPRVSLLKHFSPVFSFPQHSAARREGMQLNQTESPRSVNHPPLPPLTSWPLSGPFWRSPGSPGDRRPEGVRSLCCATPATGRWKTESGRMVSKKTVRKVAQQASWLNMHF